MVPHYFNTEENLDYVGPMPDISHYVVDEMVGGEGRNCSSGIRHASLNYSITDLYLKHSIRMTSRHYDKPVVFFDASFYRSEILTFSSNP